MDRNSTDLQARVEKFCLSPGPLFTDENELLLSDLLKALFLEKDYKNRNQLLQMIGMVRCSSDTSIATYSTILGSIAFAAYESNENDFAEFLFRSVCDLTDSISNKNNLAYMLRRYKSGNINSREIITLLLPGVKEYEPYCLTNMALLFALNLSTSDDWKHADVLFSLMPDNINGVDTWWENLGRNNEIEGYLVHFFLLRYDRITHSCLGTIKSLAWRLKRMLDKFPAWLSEQYEFDSLSDVLRNGDGVYSDELLEEYLDTMPNDRVSIDIMIDALKIKKPLPIYAKLFSKCRDLLTDVEKASLDYEYRCYYDNPFATKLNTVDDVSSCLSEVSSQEDFNLLYEYILRISEGVSFSSVDSIFGKLLFEMAKNDNTLCISYLVNWFRNDTDNKWWPLIPVDRVFAEIVRLSCAFDKPDCIEALRNSGADYKGIREECWDEPFVGLDEHDDSHSSPLVFAIDANSRACYMVLLKWMSGENLNISEEGKYIWVSSKCMDVFTVVPDLLKDNNIDWPISIE